MVKIEIINHLINAFLNEFFKLYYYDLEGVSVPALF